VKTEAAYGADPGHADVNAQLVRNIALTYNATPQNRATQDVLLRPYRSPLITGRSYSLSYQSDLKGSDAALEATKFVAYTAELQACGFTVDIGAPAAHVYTMGDNASGIESVAFQYEQHGLTYLIVGARGNGVFNFVPGQPATIDWTFSGLASTKPAAAGMTTPDYTTGPTTIDVPPPICVGVTLDFTPFTNAPAAGAFGHIRSVSIDLRNQVVPRASFNLGSTGIGEYIIAGHGTVDDPGIAVTVEVEMPSADVAAWWDRYLTHATSPWYGVTEVDQTAADLEITVGDVAGNIHHFQLGGLALWSMQPLDMGDGRYGFTLEFRVLGATAPSTTEDDLVITTS